MRSAHFREASVADECRLRERHIIDTNLVEVLSRSLGGPDLAEVGSQDGTCKEQDEAELVTKTLSSRSAYELLKTLCD